MTSPTFTRTSPAPPVSDRFTLDRKAAVAFLARCRMRQRELPVPGASSWEDWYPERDWDPRETSDLFHLEALISQAAAAGALVPPPGWDLQLLTIDDDEGAKYMWRLGYWDETVPHLGFTLAGESLEDLSIIGKWGTTGTNGALHVLNEAVECANRILAAYTQAGGRLRLSAARAAEIPA